MEVPTQTHRVALAVSIDLEGMEGTPIQSAQFAQELLAERFEGYGYGVRIVVTSAAELEA